MKESLVEVKIRECQTRFYNSKKEHDGNIKMRLQKYRDLQEKKHQKFLEAKYQAKKYHQDSIRLMRKVVETQEQLMTI